MSAPKMPCKTCGRMSDWGDCGMHFDRFRLPPMQAPMPKIVFSKDYNWESLGDLYRDMDELLAEKLVGEFPETVTVIVSLVEDIPHNLSSER